MLSGGLDGVRDYYQLFYLYNTITTKLFPSDRNKRNTCAHVLISLSRFTDQKVPGDVVITVALVRLPLDFWHSSMLLAKAW